MKPKRKEKLTVAAVDLTINKLSDLKPAKKNARNHNQRNIDMIEQSLREVGTARSGVIDENGTILAGNGTYKALGNVGINKVKVIEAKGNEWVVVKRRGLTAVQKEKLALADNRTAELGEWDADVLGGLGVDLTPWFMPYELLQLGISTVDPDDPNEQWSGMPEGASDIIESYRKLIVHFEKKKDFVKFCASLDIKSLTEDTKYIWYPLRKRRDLSGMSVRSKK